MKFVSPAKINLFLNVLRKRKDGYHEIETLFERISLTDEITLLKIPSGIRVECSGVGARLIEPLPQDSRNLAYRAAKLLKDEYDVREGVFIQIKKRIPIGAGLGGGSSNAATVLLGLNRLWKLNLPKKKLLPLAAKLGSDVPFFIMDTPFALGWGRGEILKKIRTPRLKIWHCLVEPGFSISTQKAYQALRPALSKKKSSVLRKGGARPSFLTPQKTDVRMLIRSLREGHKPLLQGLLTNSLELALNKRVIEISRVKKELARQGALACLMSGSGSCVFGIFSSQAKAEQAARFLKKNKSWQVFVVSTY